MDKVSIANIVRFTNTTSFVVNYKIKTTHPKDITAQPAGGSLSPSQYTDVLLGWESDALVPGPDDLSNLVPPRQPKICIEQYHTTENGVMEALPSVKLPVSFLKPGAKDKFSLVVNGRVQSSFSKIKGKGENCEGPSVEYPEVFDDTGAVQKSKSPAWKQVAGDQLTFPRTDKPALAPAPPQTLPSNAAQKDCQCIVQ
eukprot:GGOE01036189.1.p1 GENE.GGOE01036189.1~~GGOE01036189.1.p1  ORF type:complete len:225 (+),score=12.58 GGOE01036189.1:84-677(+)